MNYSYLLISLRRGLKKNLRDVLQEREGTYLNYFKVFYNYIKQFSRCIPLYLCPFWAILVHLASQNISVHLGLSWPISDCLHQSRPISDCLEISLAISDYLRLSWTILDYLGLSQAISDYLRLSRAISIEYQLSGCW